MKFKILILLLVLSSCSPALKKSTFKVGSSGAYWEHKKYDRVQRKKLTYYRMGWGVGNCPVYYTGPVRRDVMKRQHYYRHR